MDGSLGDRKCNMGNVNAPGSAAGSVSMAPENNGPYSKKKVGRPRGTAVNKVMKKEERVTTSSSGYPGVSWNKRMCAWLAFFYDGASRRSRTFHPKHFNMDKEKARLAAVEFMKTVEGNGRKKNSKKRGAAAGTGTVVAGAGKNNKFFENPVGQMPNNRNNSNDLNSLNNANLQMQLMSMNPAFYMSHLNRNFNLGNMSPNERNSLNNSFNSLANSNLNNLPKNIQDQVPLYMNNPLFNNLHLLNSSNNGINSTSNNSGNSSNSNVNTNVSTNYLNELLFQANLLPGSLNFPDLNIGSNNSNDMHTDDNMIFQSKEVETLMGLLFRQSYNSANNVHSNNSGNNNSNNANNASGVTGNNGNNNNNTNNQMHAAAGGGKHFSGNSGNSSSGMNAHTNNNANSGNNSGNNNAGSGGGSGSAGGNGNGANNNANSLNTNTSQNMHMYMPNQNADMFDTGSNDPSGNHSNLPNTYDYNFDLYRRNIPPHIMNAVNRMSNELKEEKGQDAINEELNDLSFRLPENAAWINQLRQAHPLYSSLNNTGNNNQCDACNTTSPQHGMKNSVDLGKRKKSNSFNNMNSRKNDLVDETRNFDINLPCSCSNQNQLRNSKNNFCLYHDACSSSPHTDNFCFLNWNSPTGSACTSATKNNMTMAGNTGMMTNVDKSGGGVNSGIDNSNANNNNSGSGDNNMNLTSNVSGSDTVSNNNRGAGDNTLTGNNNKNTNKGNDSGNESTGLCLNSNSNGHVVVSGSGNSTGKRQSGAQNMEMTGRHNFLSHFTQNHNGSHNNSSSSNNNNTNNNATSPSLSDLQKQLQFANCPNMPADMQNQLNIFKQNSGNSFSQKNLSGKVKTQARERKCSNMQNAINSLINSQGNKKNGISSANTNINEHNLCTKLNSIINFDCINAEKGMVGPNGNGSTSVNSNKNANSSTTVVTGGSPSYFDKSDN